MKGHEDLVRAVESDEFSILPKKPKKVMAIGDVPLPPGRPSRKGFSKRRLRVEKEKYHSGSSQSTSVGDESGTSGTSVSDLDEKVDALTTDEVLEAADAHGTADAPSPEVREATEGSGASELRLRSSGAGSVSRQTSRRSRGSQSVNAAEQMGRRRGRHRTWKLDTWHSEAETRAQAPVSSRKFSFTDLSLIEVWNTIREETSMDWMHEFWEVVLTSPYPAACKTLAMRSLGNWVSIYNNWQALGKWRPGHAPQFFNAYDTQQIFELPWTRVMELVELFDKAHAGDPEDNVAARLPVDALLSASVLLSKVISKKQKTRFLLGIFDGNDQRLFDKGKLMRMMKAVYHGIAAMFGIQDTNVERIETFACHLFQRILHVYEDQKGEVLGDATSLPSSLIEEWLLGHSDDPLNLPFVLFIERFSVPGQEDDPELFEEEARKFRLSHRSPVALPLETALSLDSRGFLRRHEVIAIDRIFSYCISIGSFDISHADAEKALNGIQMDLVDLWMERLCPALDLVEESRTKISLSGFLKQLCPKATGRHLRMFHSWIKEYEQLESLKLEVQATHEVLRRFGRPASFSQSQDVKDIILEVLERHLLQQEEKIQHMERLFSPRLLGATVPSERLLKCHVSKQQWQTWNRTLDLLEVEDQEKFQTSGLLPLEVHKLLLRAVVKDSYSLNRARFLKFFCEVFNVRPLK